MLVLEGQLQFPQHYWLGIYLDNCDIELFALETNRDHSVIFEIVPKYCISDSFVDYEGYSISSQGFLPTVADKMVKVTQSCPTLCDPMDYTVHGILQARLLEWVAFPFSRGSPQARSPALEVDSLPAEPQGSPRILEWVAYHFLDLPNPGVKPGSPALQADSLPTELSGSPRYNGHLN